MTSHAWQCTRSACSACTRTCTNRYFNTVPGSLALEHLHGQLVSRASCARAQVAKAGSGPISTGAAALGGDLLFVASAASDSLLLYSPAPAAPVCRVAQPHADPDPTLTLTLILTLTLTLTSSVASTASTATSLVRWHATP